METIGKLTVLVLSYIAGTGVGLYKAFIINKAVFWYMPQYYGVVGITQIWAVLVVYGLVTHKMSKEDTEDEGYDVVSKRIIKGIAMKAVALSITWYALYLVKVLL